MSAKTHPLGQTLSAALVMLSVAVFAMGQARHNKAQERTQPPDRQLDTVVPSKSNARQQATPSPSPSQSREERSKPPDPTTYSYEFTQPQFYIRRILVEHDALGRGRITFERQGEETGVVEPVELSTAALGRIMGLWIDLHFLESREDYQSDKQFPHLGTMRIHMENGANRRTAEFNWTRNKLASALVNEYRRVADQAIFLFDLAVARENQPLNAPKLMEQLDQLISRNGLSDQYQLIPLLRDLTTDEHVPLIARNHAGRLLKRIEK